MSDPTLIDSAPDLLLLVRRDGTVVAHAGGDAVAELGGGRGREAFEPAWTESTATLIRQLARKAIAGRAVVEARFDEYARTYEVRATPQGPDRAICSIRPVLESRAPGPGLDATGEHPLGHLDRRGFLRRFQESTSMAALRESPLAVALIYVDGIVDVAQVIATKVSEQIMSTAIGRLMTHVPDPADGGPGWYLGQLAENLLAVVVESRDRDAIEQCVGDVCASLRAPVAVGDAQFFLEPYAGVGILGIDASTPRVLLDHARTGAAEARRLASREVVFFSDTMQLKSLARIDIARELHDAIERGEIRLRYRRRHDLQTGRTVAWVGYARWLHPLRGEIRPAEFLRMAQTTGLATKLSRAILEQLPDDFAALGEHADADVRISLGALRDHVLHEDFAAELHDLLAGTDLPPERLELRVAENVVVARDFNDFRSLEHLGVRLVVDEVGRSVGSLAALARAPAWGLQLDRSWALAVHEDAVARSVCGAGIAMAEALGLVPIATGVDGEAQRDALLELGCRYGLGDLYGGLGADAEAVISAA